MALSENAAAMVAKIEAEIQERETAKAKIIEADSTAQVTNLAAFEAMSDAERADLYRRAPTHYRSMMQAMQAKNFEKLYGRRV